MHTAEFTGLVCSARATGASLMERHEAFGELVLRFQDMAYGYAYSILGNAQLAQDAAQEAFLAAYQNLEQLRDPRAFPACCDVSLPVGAAVWFGTTETRRPLWRKPARLPIGETPQPG